MTDLDYTVGLDPRQFGQGARRVEQTSARLRGRLQTDFRANGRSVAAFARNMRNAVTVVTAVAAATGVALKRTVDQVAELAAQAETAGVSFEAFQELKFAADRNLISVDALTDGLKEMQLRIDEFVVTDAGPAEESLKRLGFTVDELKEGLKDPPRLFEEIIDRVKQLDQAAQVRILDELFGGTAAEQFQRLMDDAAGSISAARDQARQLGVVLDEDYKRQVEEINERWNTMVSIIGTNVRRAVVDLTNDVIGLIDRFREVEARGNLSLENRLTAISQERLALENRILAVKDEQRNVTGVLAQAERRNLQGTINSLRSEFASLTAEERRIMDEMNRRRNVSVDPTPRLTFTPIATDDGDKGGRRSGRSRAKSEAEKQAEALDKVLQSLRDEYAQLGLNEQQQRVYNELKRAGVDASSAAGQEIARLIDRIESERAAIEGAARASEFLNDTLAGAFQDLVPDIETGIDALDRFVNTLVEAGVQAAIFGRGPLAGLFGGGGGLALGGGLGRGAGGLLGGFLIPGILHGGGTAGRDGYNHNRAVPLAAFAHAQRYHNGGIAGLKPNEVPAILERGERVIPNGAGPTARQVFDLHVTGRLVEENGQIMAIIDEKSQSAAATVAGAVPAMVDARNATRETRRIRPQRSFG